MSRPLLEPALCAGYLTDAIEAGFEYHWYRLGVPPDFERTIRLAIIALQQPSANDPTPAFPTTATIRRQILPLDVEYWALRATTSHLKRTAV